MHCDISALLEINTLKGYYRPTTAVRPWYKVSELSLNNNEN